MSLFQWGDFTLHSGEKSWWRIDCDGLQDSEVELLAKLIYDKVGTFHGVQAPNSHPGSVAPRLVNCLARYMGVQEFGKMTILVVDDVLTTGKSLTNLKEIWERNGCEVVGAVIFARGECPDWVTPLFRM